MGEKGVFHALLLIVAFVSVGGFAEWLLSRFMRGANAAYAGNEPATVRERLQAIGMRFLSGALKLGAFALGSVGVFLAFNWPPLLRTVILAYLGAFVVLRMVRLGATSCLPRTPHRCA